ncbi:ADP-ribosyltransferase, partial [Thermobifida halotolerans]|uniref:ADP-ribosyltransferase n=1 Tax=Thermobifida halotolerans TaxID=483545 RepID=UPI000AC9501A
PPPPNTPTEKSDPTDKPGTATPPATSPTQKTATGPNTADLTDTGSTADPTVTAPDLTITTPDIRTTTPDTTEDTGTRTNNTDNAARNRAAAEEFINSLRTAHFNGIDSFGNLTIPTPPPLTAFAVYDITLDSEQSTTTPTSDTTLIPGASSPITSAPTPTTTTVDSRTTEGTQQQNRSAGTAPSANDSTPNRTAAPANRSSQQAPQTVSSQADRPPSSTETPAPTGTEAGRTVSSQASQPSAAVSQESPTATEPVVDRTSSGTSDLSPANETVAAASDTPELGGAAEQTPETGHDASAPVSETNTPPEPTPVTTDPTSEALRSHERAVAEQQGRFDEAQRRSQAEQARWEAAQTRENDSKTAYDKSRAAYDKAAASAATTRSEWQNRVEQAEQRAQNSDHRAAQSRQQAEASRNRAEASERAVQEAQAALDQARQDAQTLRDQAAEIRANADRTGAPETEGQPAPPIETGEQPAPPTETEGQPAPPTETGEQPAPPTETDSERAARLEQEAQALVERHTQALDQAVRTRDEDLRTHQADLAAADRDSAAARRDRAAATETASARERAVARAEQEARTAQQTMERDLRNWTRDQLDRARIERDYGAALQNTATVGHDLLDARGNLRTARLAHLESVRDAAEQAARQARDARDEAAEKAREKKQEADEQRKRLQLLEQELRTPPGDTVRTETTVEPEGETTRVPDEQVRALEEAATAAETAYADRLRAVEEAERNLEHAQKEARAELIADAERANVFVGDEQRAGVFKETSDSDVPRLEADVARMERESGRSREDDLDTYSRQLDHLLGSELLETQRIGLTVPGSEGGRGFDGVLEGLAQHLPEGFRDAFAAEFARNPYPFFSHGGHSVTVGDRTATLRLGSRSNDWRRTGDLPKDDDSTPGLSNSDSAGRPLIHQDTRGENAHRGFGGTVYVNPLFPIPLPASLGPAITFTALGSVNQPSASEVIGRDAAMASSASVSGRAVEYFTDLRAELTLGPDSQPRDRASEQAGAEAQDVELTGPAVFEVPRGLSLTVELGERSSEAPDHIRLRDPFDTTEPAPDAVAGGNAGIRVGNGHPAAVNGVYAAEDTGQAQEDGQGTGGRRGGRRTMAEWVVDHLSDPRPRNWFQRAKDTVLPNFLRRRKTAWPHGHEAAEIRHMLSDDSVRDNLKAMTKGPIYLEVRDNAGHERLVKMWSVPTELTRIPDVPAGLGLEHTVSSSKEVENTFLRSDSVAGGFGGGFVLQAFNSQMRTELPLADYRHDRERAIGTVRVDKGGVGRVTHTEDAAMYAVNRNFYLQFDGEDTPHRFTGQSIEILGVDDARLLRDPDLATPDARSRGDHAPVYSHLGEDRPDHFGGTTVRGVTWEDGSQYTTWSPAAPTARDSAAAPDTAPRADSPPRTVIDAYAQQVLTGIARQYPGLVIPDIARARSEYARRPPGQVDHSGRFFSRENHFRRDHEIALYNTARILEQISETNLTGLVDEWTSDGIDVHLIETALVDPENREGWFRPDYITVRLRATPSGREFGGTVTKNHTATSTDGSASHRRAEEHERLNRIGLRVRTMFRDMPNVDARWMARFQAGGGFRGQYQRMTSRGLETDATVKTSGSFTHKGDTDIWRYKLRFHAEMGKFRKTDDLPADVRTTVTQDRPDYDGYRVNLLTDADGNPIQLTGRIELETPAPADPGRTGPDLADEGSGDRGAAERTSTLLSAEQARGIVNGARPPIAARQPGAPRGGNDQSHEAAVLDTLPTATEGISARAGDSTLRQRLYGLLRNAPGLQNFLKRPAGHDFFTTLFGRETLAGHTHALDSNPGYRTRNWMRDFFFSGRHTTVLHADRTDVTFHDILPDSDFKTSHTRSTGITRSTVRGHFLSGDVEARVVGNPNPSARGLKEDPDNPTPGRTTSNTANAPSFWFGWNPLTAAKRWISGIADTAAFSQKTSFKPQGGVRPYTADLRLTETAEVRDEYDFMVNVPRSPRDEHYSGTQTTVPRAEFGFAPLHALYDAGLVNDRIDPDTGHPVPQANPELGPDRFRIRPGFEDQGHHLATVPRTPAPGQDADARTARQAQSQDSTGVRLAERLREDNYELTGHSRESVLNQITAQLARSTDDPSTVSVKLRARHNRFSRHPEQTGPNGERASGSFRGELKGQIRHGTVTIEAVRQPPRVVQLGGSGTFEHDHSVSTEHDAISSTGTTLGTRAEFLSHMPTPLPRGDEPRDLPSELPRPRLVNVSPALTAGMTTGTAHKSITATTGDASWTTAINGPYAVTETPAHIRLTITYGSRTFTVEGDHSTVKEAFPAAYLDLVDQVDAETADAERNAEAEQAPDSAEQAPMPRLAADPGQLDGAVRDWRGRPRPQDRDQRGADQQDAAQRGDAEGGARRDGATARPHVDVAPLTVQDKGHSVQDAAYVALARAHGWRHTGDLTADDVRNAKSYAVRKTGIDPNNDPVTVNLNDASLKVLFHDAADPSVPDGAALLDIGRTRWRLGAIPHFDRAAIVDVAVDATNTSSRGSGSLHLTTVADSSGTNANISVRPAAWLAESPPEGTAADSATSTSPGAVFVGVPAVATAGGDSTARTDGHVDSDPGRPGPDPTGKRSYLVRVPTSWIVAAENPHTHIPGIGRTPTRGFAETDSAITAWISENQARTLGLLDGDRVDSGAWDGVAKAQQELADAEKDYYSKRAALLPLVDSLARDPDDQDVRVAYERQQQEYDRAKAAFEEKFTAWRDAWQKARQRTGEPGAATRGDHDGHDDQTPPASEGTLTPRPASPGTRATTPDTPTQDQPATTGTSDTPDTPPQNQPTTPQPTNSGTRTTQNRPTAMPSLFGRILNPSQPTTALSTESAVPSRLPEEDTASPQAETAAETALEDRQQNSSAQVMMARTEPAAPDSDRDGRPRPSLDTVRRLNEISLARLRDTRGAWQEVSRLESELSTATDPDRGRLEQELAEARGEALRAEFVSDLADALATSALRNFTPTDYVAFPVRESLRSFGRRFRERVLPDRTEPTAVPVPPSGPETDAPPVWSAPLSAARGWGDAAAPTPGMGAGRRFTTDAEAREWARQHFAVPDLADDEHHAVIEYALHGGYINAMMRGELTDLPPERLTDTQRTVEGVDRVLHRSSAPESLVVYRTLKGLPELGGDPNDEASMNALVGRTVTDSAYQSASISADSLFFPNRPITVMLAVPRGYPALNVMDVRDTPFPEQQEILLPREATYVIHDVRRQHGRWLVQAEIVPDGWQRPAGWTPAALDDVPVPKNTPAPQSAAPARLPRLSDVPPEVRGAITRELSAGALPLSLTSEAARHAFEAYYDHKILRDSLDQVVSSFPADMVGEGYHPGVFLRTVWYHWGESGALEFALTELGNHTASAAQGSRPAADASGPGAPEDSSSPSAVDEALERWQNNPNLIVMMALTEPATPVGASRSEPSGPAADE